MLREALDNPRTSFAGLAVIGLAAALVFGRITVDQFVGAFGVIAGSGLLMAKDAKK